MMNTPRKDRAHVCFITTVLLLPVLLETSAVESVGLSSIKSILPRDADLNGDGVVSVEDFYVFETCFELSPSHANWNAKADINDDGSMNVLDVILAASMFGKTHVLTHIAAYTSTFTDETAQFVASHFDLILTVFETAPTVGKIKSLNHRVIILGYKDIMHMHSYYEDWAEVDSHEDWFLHDIHGNRLVNKFWDCYGMDVGNPGWRSHYANYVKNKLDTYLSFDGVFADDTWDQFRSDSWTVNSSQIPAEIGLRWHNDMLGMVTYVKNEIGNKLLIVNTRNNDDYIDACDGKTEEGFVHPSWFSTDEFYDADRWKGEIEDLKHMSQSGKFYLPHSGTTIPENPDEGALKKVHDVMIYCFASYLLSVGGGKATFGFNSIYSNDGSCGYYPEFDVSLGLPVGEYYSIGLVYARNFTDGKVLANPTTSSHTINLEGEYKTLDGQVVSNVTLTPHSSIILLGS